MESEVKLQHKVNFRWLIVFALPTILSSIFSSFYSAVDGIFVFSITSVPSMETGIHRRRVWLKYLCTEKISVLYG